MITSYLQKWLLGAGSLLVVILGAFFKGAASARQKHAQKQAENYIKTRERIDEAATTKRDADDAREWLRNRNK